MISNVSKPLQIPQFANLTQRPGTEFRRRIQYNYRAWTLTPRSRLCSGGLSIDRASHNCGGFRARCASDTSSSPAAYVETEGGAGGEEDAEAMELFEKIRDAERVRVEKLEEFENKANVQLERQIMMASNWSRALLTLQGKLKGTEWDPEDSHKIDYSEFLRLISSNNVQYMEYSDFGQKVSVILPYYKEKEKKRKSSGINPEKEIVYKRHIVDKMPVDCWNDVWQKLHQQLVNVDVINVKTVPTEVYSTVAITVVWSMRLFLAIGFYLWVDSIMRPIYAKRIPGNLGKASKQKRLREPLKNASLGSLGKSRAKFISAEETTGVTFDDFAGQDYIKEELQEIVHILKNEDKYKEKGIYCPKGVLLHGPPGTGKTLLARAIAGEAGLPFFAANGTDFVEMFVGVAAARVRDLFASARSYAPSIIFIDEIDAIGSKRGGPDFGGGGAERVQGLLQILTEMDGFKEATEQVLVIGATNRLDILDPAILRKGRFDKIVRVGLPSKEGRLAILKVHARDKKFRSEEEKNILLEEVTEKTEDTTGAELQNILNEAGILTARKDQDYITRVELEEAMDRQKGTFKTGQEDIVFIPPEMTLRLAYREAALAVLACYDPDPHHTFVGTHINGTTEQPNIVFEGAPGRIFAKKSDYVRAIVRACAPRVIEEEIFGIDNLCWISANAASKASSMAENFILRSGMTALGKAYYRNSKDIVPNLEAKLDALRDEYVRFGVETCTIVLREYRAAVEKIVAILGKTGQIKSEQVLDIYNKTPRFPQPPVAPLDEYGALIYAGRWGIHGISCPGRVTFVPGNAGFATFGGPRPTHTQYLSDDILDVIDNIVQTNFEEIKNMSDEAAEVDEKPVVLMASHFL